MQYTIHAFPWQINMRHVIHKKQRMCHRTYLARTRQNLHRNENSSKNTNTLIAYYCLVFVVRLPLPYNTQHDSPSQNTFNIWFMLYGYTIKQLLAYIL